MVSIGEALIVLGILIIIAIVAAAVFDGNIWAYVVIAIISVIAIVIGIIIELKDVLAPVAKLAVQYAGEGAVEE